GLTASQILRGSLNAAVLRMRVEVSDPSDILQPHQMEHAVSWLPARFAESPWQLLYSSSQHGISMNTFYRCHPTGFVLTLVIRRAREHPGSSILVIRDHQHHVFGAFLSDPWRVMARLPG